MSEPGIKGSDELRLTIDEFYIKFSLLTTHDSILTKLGI